MCVYVHVCGSVCMHVCNWDLKRVSSDGYRPVVYGGGECRPRNVSCIISSRKDSAVPRLRENHVITLTQCLNIRDNQYYEENFVADTFTYICQTDSADRMG